MNGGAIFLIIFLAIVAGLVVIGIFGSKRSKKKKAEKFVKEKKIEKVAKKLHVELYIVLKMLIDFVNNEVANVDVGANSISEINKRAISFLRLIKESEEVKEIYKSEDRKREFQLILENLYNSKPSKWNEESYFAINVINAKVDSISKQESLSQIIKSTKERYENKFKSA